MNIRLIRGAPLFVGALLGAALAMSAQAEPVKVRLDWPTPEVSFPKSVGRIEVLNAQSGNCADGLEGFKWSHSVHDQDIAKALAAAGCPADTMMIWHAVNGDNGKMRAYVIDSAGKQVWLGDQMRKLRDKLGAAADESLRRAAGTLRPDEDGENANADTLAQRFSSICGSRSGAGDFVRLFDTIRFRTCSEQLASIRRTLDYTRKNARGRYGADRIAVYERFLALAQVGPKPEGDAVAAHVLERAKTARFVEELDGLASEYVSSFFVNGSEEERPIQNAIREQLAIAVAHRVGEFKNPPAWLMTAGFASRPAAERDYSVNEQALRGGAPLSQFAGKAPTDVEIGLALLRSMAAGGNVGVAGGKREGANTVALTAVKGIPADVGGGRFAIKNVKKSACTPVGERFNCTYKLWAELAFSEAQNDIFARMPESLYGMVVGPILAFNQKSHELQEVFELTADGWRAPEVEARMSDMSLNYQQGVVAGMRASARYNTCMARQLANDPTVNNDPDC